MKKIVIFTYSLMGGGAERTVANLLNGLKNDFDIHLVLMNSTIDYEIPTNQKVYFLEQSSSTENEFFKFSKIPILAYRFAHYCNNNNIDLVLSVMNRPNYVATLAKTFGIKTKVLISEQFYTPYFCNNESIGSRIKSYLVKTLYPKADLILPNSYGTGSALKNIFNVHQPLKVIKNPTDIDGILKKKQEPVDDIIFDKFTFVNLAAFRPEKNHHLLIDAFSKLKGESCQLLLIGKGPLKKEIQEKVINLGLEAQVKFIEFTNNPYKYLHKSDCFVLSSFGEGFPNVLIEAMACSLPIISTDCQTGPRELLAPNSDFDFQLKEAIEYAELGILTPTNNVGYLSEVMREVYLNSSTLKKYKPKLEINAMKFDNKLVSEEFKLIIQENIHG